jgi:hypothetical protein
MDRITQNRKILGFMRLHGSITPAQALRTYNVYRLGARIFELKRQGHTITSKLVRSLGGKHYARYTLHE